MGPGGSVGGWGRMVVWELVGLVGWYSGSEWCPMLQKQHQWEWIDDSDNCCWWYTNGILFTNRGQFKAVLLTF